jgi:large repetitive protein
MIARRLNLAGVAAVCRAMGGRTFASALAALAACCLLLAPAAQATFHLIKVREVHPSAGQDGYVELQMFAGGQSFLGGRSMTLYNAAGALVHSSTFSAGVANSQNQATVLVGDSGVQSSFGVAPDLIDSALSIPASGGAACWNAGGIPADCVAWGNFSGGAALQTATGTTVGSPVSPGGVTSGKAIRRTIEPGCPTLLEDSDDSNASATDLSEVTPAPRNNGSAISEKTCAGAPNTVIDDRPPAVTNVTNAAFTYESPTATSYECKLDSAAFASCEADGIEYEDLADGAHGFQVRGVNASGPDPTPATYNWRVDTAPPTAAIDQKPADPSSGASATFAFHADETGSKFACSLTLEGQPDSFSACISSKTYTSLADGDWTFKLRATDAAGNQQPTPTTYSWTVDNSLADTTPPQTTITGHPTDPSSSSDAAFSYGSNEPGSTFECSLDGGFSPCPPSGISYSGLAQGSHSFQVRAIDTSANVDPSPAGFSFQVVLPVVQLVPPLLSPPLAAAVEPQTFISRKPAAKSPDRTPTFRFHSDQAGAAYQCALDRGPFRTCRSPFTSKPLKPGPHKFSVRAVLAGASDSSPATFRFKVVGHR